MGKFRIAIALISGWFLFGGLLFPALLARAQAPATLPDAPQPAIIAGGAISGALLPRAEGGARARRLRWRPYINPGQAHQPLTARQKMQFWLHLEARPYAPLPSFMSAGFEQAVDGNPKFGTDSGAFGERLGAAFVRDASMRFFVGSFFPALFHEDPRYYRMQYGSDTARGLWAGKEALVTRTDSGRVTPNYSDLLGHLAACTLTQLYYPAPSANGRVVVEMWATSIAGDAGNNLLLEFVPSIANRWRRHRRLVRSRSSQQRPSPSIP